MKYFSQSKQDVYLDTKIFKGRMGGTFVDIGAHDGLTLSNTFFFEKYRSWKGICVEPIPDRFRELEKNRSCVKVNGCIAERNEKRKFLKIEGYAEMLSGLVDEYHSNHQNRIEKELKEHGGTKSEIEVQCFVLSDLLEKHNMLSVDYCSIDTEGNELSILKSIDFEKVTIDVFTVENVYDTDEILNFMKSKNYKLISRLGGDDVYKRRESKPFWKFW